MNIFGVGPLEFFLIIVIALIIMGPRDMVKAGRTLGSFLRKLVVSPTWHAIQKTSNDLRRLPTKLMDESGLNELERSLQGDLKEVEQQLTTQTQIPLPGLENPPLTPINQPEEAPSNQPSGEPLSSEEEKP